MRSLRALLPLICLAMVVGGCSADPYPLSASPGASQRSPAAIGQAIPAVVLYIELRPGDRIEIVSAEPIGLTDGVSAEFLFSPTVVHADGTRMLGEELDPLAGAVATAPAGTADPDSTVAIVVRLTASRPGRYTLSGVRLTYRLNGGSPQTRTGIDVVDTICAADPAPADCPEAA